MPLPWGAPAGRREAAAEHRDRVHAAGVVHGDLKPQNILMHDGRPVLIDFGLATLRASFVPHLDGPAVGGGTPSWWAPEQAVGEADARADLFAPGRMLAAAVPAAERPPALRTLVDALLQEHPAHRPAHAVGVARTLHQLAGTEPPVLPPPPPHPPRMVGRDAVVQAVVRALGAGSMVSLQALDDALGPGQPAAVRDALIDIAAGRPGWLADHLARCLHEGTLYAGTCGGGAAPGSL